MTLTDLDEPSFETENQSIEISNDTLKVPSGKKRRVKSPTPGVVRASSTTPVRGRSQTPFTLYLNRRSADPTEPPKWRSITPFINRQDKERTPFELGKDIKTQLISHKMVFDKASVMDISEADFEPVRYITSDVSVIDRASVMDVSNVEVIYLVEEYEEEYTEYEEEKEEETMKKKKGKKGRKSKSMDKEDSPTAGEPRKKETKTKKKTEKKKKEESRSPSPPPLPKLTLKLELGGGSKMNKKMFEQKPAAEAKPPPKKVKPPVANEEQLKEPTPQDLLAEDQNDHIEGAEDNEGSIILEETTSKNIESEFDRMPGEGNDTAVADKTESTSEITENVQSTGNLLGEAAPQVTLSQVVNEPPLDAGAKEAVEHGAKEVVEHGAKEVVKKEKRVKKIIEEDTSPTTEQIELWDKIAVDEGKRFMEKIKKFAEQKRNDPKIPAFINYLPNSTALEGQNLRLVCAVNGIDLSIKWHKNGNEIKSDDHYKIRADKNNILSLCIAKCIPEDTGNYSCTISNKQKNITSNCFVSIYDLSRFQDEPCPPSIDFIEDTYHYINDELMIECRVHGCPRPTLTWSRENYEIKKEHALIEEAHGIHRMIIKNPCPNDTGIYVVKAVNSRGEHERKHCVEFFVTTEKVIY